MEVDDPFLHHSTIYVTWNHPENTTSFSYYMASWNPVGDVQRIEEKEKTSEPIPYNPNEGPLAIYIFDITQGESYNVQVISVDDEGMQVYSVPTHVQTCEKNNVTASC